MTKLTETIDYCINLVENELVNLEIYVNTYGETENPPYWIADWKEETEDIREHIENLKELRGSHSN